MEHWCISIKTTLAITTFTESTSLFVKGRSAAFENNIVDKSVCYINVLLFLNYLLFVETTKMAFVLLIPKDSCMFLKRWMCASHRSWVNTDILLKLIKCIALPFGLIVRPLIVTKLEDNQYISIAIPIEVKLSICNNWYTWHVHYLYIATNSYFCQYLFFDEKS